jgi:hypothetical protein
LWIRRVLVDLRTLQIQVLRNRESKPHAEAFARQVIAHAETSRDLVSSLHDEIEFHSLLNGYATVLDEARELLG